MTDYSKAVTWKEGDRHRIGRVAIVRYCETMTGHVLDYWIDSESEFKTTHPAILVVSEPDGELNFIAKRMLSNYPSEPIEEPTK